MERKQVFSEGNISADLYDSGDVNKCLEHIELHILFNTLRSGLPTNKTTMGKPEHEDTTFICSFIPEVPQFLHHVVGR